LYKYGDLAPFALYHLHISHFFGDQRKFAQKTTTWGGGGDGAGPQCFLFQKILTHKKTGKFLKYGFSIVNSTIVS
jgi:hypothetical protein